MQVSLNPVDAAHKAQIDLITGGNTTSNNIVSSSVDWLVGDDMMNPLIDQDLLILSIELSLFSSVMVCDPIAGV